MFPEGIRVRIREQVCPVLHQVTLKCEKVTGVKDTFFRPEEPVLH